MVDRDENAFKQHSLSEGHVRQMLVVGEHAKSYIENYSKEFLSDFIQLLSRRWGTKRVRANQVYQEFIQDKQHTHMNATKWVTLTGFIQYLGKNGICHVDETEKGWFISWIDTSPKALAKQDAALKKERQDLGDEERQRRMINEQIERVKALEAARAQNGDDEGPSSARSTTSGQEDELDVTTLHPIKLSIGGIGKGKQREDPTNDLHADGDSAQAAPQANAAGTVDNEEQLKNVSANGSSSDPQAVLISAEPVTVAAAPPKPKVNPLKSTGRPNPLKSNPLKAKSLKPENPPSSGSAPAKKPLTAMEQIALEEQERQRRRQNGGGSGRGGHSGRGFPPRH